MVPRDLPGLPHATEGLQRDCFHGLTRCQLEHVGSPRGDPHPPAGWQCLSHGSGKAEGETVMERGGAERSVLGILRHLLVPAHCHFYHILLAKASHKTSPR